MYGRSITKALTLIVLFFTVLAAAMALPRHRAEASITRWRIDSGRAGLRETDGNPDCLRTRQTGCRLAGD